jgi:dTDP-4-dehydrorhamnose reductase
MSKKLVIFGGSGFVGGNMTKIAQEKGWQVVIADNRSVTQADYRLVDITDKNSVERVIAETEPTAVVNVAAIADIDQAEREQGLAYKVNVDGARNVAESCTQHRIRYVFFSSDAVFDGESSSYKEDDPLAPVNYYGRTKMEAEKAVFQACPGAAVIRISLVLGYPVQSGNSFFANLHTRLQEGNDISTPTDEIRTPVDVYTLSECILELCENEYAGVLHIGATDSINRYELTRELARRMGYNEDLIRPQPASSVKPGRAARHKNGIISVAKAHSLLKTSLLSTAESIQRAFDQPG